MQNNAWQSSPPEIRFKASCLKLWTGKPSVELWSSFEILCVRNEYLAFQPFQINGKVLWTYIMPIVFWPCTSIHLYLNTKCTEKSTVSILHEAAASLSIMLLTFFFFFTPSASKTRTCPGDVPAFRATFLEDCTSPLIHRSQAGGQKYTLS